MPVIAEAASGKRQLAAAEALIGKRVAAVLHAVGARDDQRDRQARRLAGLIAHEARDVHLLAGAVDAALGVEVAVERARGLAALDAAVGQVEGARGEIEEGVLAVVALGDEQRRLQAAFAARRGPASNLA